MMKIVQINTTCGIGSTGKICTGISQLLTENNVENYILYSTKSNGYSFGIQCSDENYIKIQVLKSRIFGNYGFNSKKVTKKMIRELDKINPDIVHVHNIHGHDCHFEILFNYLKKNKVKVVYTFHDCWAFTGYCPHFAIAQCDNWSTGCGQCVLRKRYSWFFDKSAQNYSRKRVALEGVDLTVVTPSHWLASLVKHSFLKNYPVKVINNGIDLAVFGPVESGFRKKYGLQNKKIVLGVSFGWSSQKGLDVFIDLAERLSNVYQIVLIGTDANVDRQLPKNIISIHRTQNQQELAQIYSAADVFVNPTREDNYPTVNMEAITCGTPVVTFDTGGSPEMLDETCGSVVAQDNMESLIKEIIRICETKPFSQEACAKKAQEFDKNERFKEYIELYERVNATGTQGNGV